MKFIDTEGKKHDSRVEMYLSNVLSTICNVLGIPVAEHDDYENYVIDVDANPTE